jgi:SP family general alpha glucoside:H+ symporter-like MFS transporter
MLVQSHNMASYTKETIDDTSENRESDRVTAKSPSSVAGSDPDDAGVLRTLKDNPIVILCCLYANLGACMYGFDNITLSLCLDMAPFV